MPILYNKINETDPPEKKKRRYTTNVQNVAPFIYNWMQDPITVGKLNAQVGEGSQNKVLKNINKAHLFDMTALGDMSENNFNDFKQIYNKRRNLNPYSAQSSINKKALGRMRLYGQRYNWDSDKGVRGVRIPRFNGIGTIYEINNPDEYGSTTHELAHISGIQDKIEKFIFDKWGARQLPYEKLKGLGFTESEKQLKYLRDIGVNENGESGEGVWPRIMQLRKILNLRPGQKITREMLNSIDINDKASPLHGLRSNWDDDTIIEILETVVDNNAPASIEKSYNTDTQIV